MVVDQCGAPRSVLDGLAGASKFLHRVTTRAFGRREALALGNYANSSSRRLGPLIVPAQSAGAFRHSSYQRAAQFCRSFLRFSSGPKNGVTKVLKATEGYVCFILLARSLTRTGLKSHFKGARNVSITRTSNRDGSLRS